MAPVLAGERVREDLACNRADAERVVEFAINEQSGVGRDDRAAKLEHQPMVEVEPDGPVSTHITGKSDIP